MEKNSIQKSLDEMRRDKEVIFSFYKIEDQEKWDEKTEEFQEKYVEVYGETFTERNLKNYETKFERLNDPWYC